MKKYEITRIFITPIAELTGVWCMFFLAYTLRSITDGIPFVQLRIPHISADLFMPFVISGVILWGGIFAYAGLYSDRSKKPFTEQIRLILKYAVIWFFGYMSFIHLAGGFIFQSEIPRLIVFYAGFFSVCFSILIRGIEHLGYKYLIKHGVIPRERILVIETNDQISLEKSDEKQYIIHHIKALETIESLIRERKIDAIICNGIEEEKENIYSIIRLARIYGISFTYPKFLPHTDKFVRRDGFIGDMPVIEIISVSISPWERITKRIIDIIFSCIGLIFLAPLLMLVAIGIKFEDPAGPIIFNNRRIGQNGKIFSLYKFRYMYWKYCVKDAYGVAEKDDDALKFEESLKKENDTRNGPLYKIKDDPRKMRFGKMIEKLSIDELPQLYNVLIGNMSLVGPRPHQPREVELYDEDDKQVLTIKPGITGMAQTYGREKNTFDEEIRLDRYYIENYSLFLDLAILIRTVIVVIGRAIKK